MSHDNPNWEYTAIPLDTAGPLVDALNERGTDGWEFVAITGRDAILKRPMRDLREIVTADQRKHVFGIHAPQSEQAS
jgi:hypothetical protein